MSITFDQADRRAIFRELVSRPADEIRALAEQQLRAIKNARASALRIQEIEYYIDNGDALKDSQEDEDRKLRRRSYALAFLIGSEVADDAVKQQEDEDLFYRGPSVSRHYYAAAKRLLKSFILSFAYLTDSVWDELKRIVNPDNVWSLILVLAGWFLASVIGGYIGAAVNAILLAVGLYDLWGRLKTSWHGFKSWFVLSYQAKGYAELEEAGKGFADGLAVGGISVLEIVLLHKAFRFVESRIASRYPAPDWLRREFKDAAELRERKRASRPPEEKPPEDRPPEEKPPEERPPEEKPPREDAEARGKRKGIREAVKAVGAGRTADELSAERALPWLLAVGVGGAALWSYTRVRR